LVKKSRKILKENQNVKRKNKRLEIISVARISKITIKNYRSIKDLSLCFPENKPVILIGENNVGKSNILKAIDLILGEYWPRNYEPDENEFYNRDPSIQIKIEVEFSENLGRFKKIIWEYKPEEEEFCWN